MSGGPSNPPASGSGVSTQRTDLPQDITDKSQDAFRGQLSNSTAATAGLTNNMPSVQTAGGFNPAALNLQTDAHQSMVGGFNPAAPNLQTSVNQTQAGPYNFGPMYNSGLSTNVQGQLSQGLANTAGITNQQNQNISKSLGGGGENEALIRSLQAQNNQGAATAASGANLAALNQQRQQDVTTQGLLQNQYGLDLSRIGQNNTSALNAGNFTNNALNQGLANMTGIYNTNLAGTNANNAAALAGGTFANNAALAGNNAANQNYATNLSGINANNMANAQNYSNRVAGVTAGNDFLKNLGTGLVSTAPQIQGNFTVGDLQNLQNNPGLLDPNLYGGGGLLSPDQIKGLGGPAAISQNSPIFQQILNQLNQQKAANAAPNNGRGY